MGGPERFKTYGNVFDAFTERNLFKLASQGFFEELASPISIGKEANIFSAVTKEGGKVIVKIYRLENCNFNKMWSYLASDPRYKNVKPQRRHVIFAWVQREFRNLLKARESGVRVPTPIHFMHNILIEEFIGGDQPAPQLKNAEDAHTPAMRDAVLSAIETLYIDAELVHGDLSPFNILVESARPILIDMSQSTAADDPHAREYLLRDVQNVLRFFDEDDDAIMSTYDRLIAAMRKKKE